MVTWIVDLQIAQEMFRQPEEDSVMEISVQRSPIGTLIPLRNADSAFCGKQLVVSVKMTTPIRRRELRYNRKIIVQLAPSMGESRAYDFCIAAEGNTEFGQ